MLAIRREIDLSVWQHFQLFIESEAAQLGMELTTYYMMCALWGMVQAMSMVRCWGAL